jgi:glycine cleavage system transcriptional repressor
MGPAAGFRYYPAMNAEQYLVLSALGPDRPGLVAEVTRYLSERGANIVDSRMIILGGEFGIMVLVSADEAELGKIEHDRGELESRTGMTVVARRTKSPLAHRKAITIPCTVVAEAIDQEGIVHKVAAALHRLGVSIVSLSTSAYNAPITGSPLFRLEASADLPQGLTLAKLRTALDEVARAENIDISVQSGPR